MTYDTLVWLIFTPLVISESGHILCSNCGKPSETRNEMPLLYKSDLANLWLLLYEQPYLYLEVMINLYLHPLLFS